MDRSGVIKFTIGFLIGFVFFWAVITAFKLGFIYGFEDGATYVLEELKDSVRLLNESIIRFNYETLTI